MGQRSREILPLRCSGTRCAALAPSGRRVGIASKHYRRGSVTSRMTSNLAAAILFGSWISTLGYSLLTSCAKSSAGRVLACWGWLALALVSPPIALAQDPQSPGDALAESIVQKADHV